MRDYEEEERQQAGKNGLTIEKLREAIKYMKDNGIQPDVDGMVTVPPVQTATPPQRGEGVAITTETPATAQPVVDLHLLQMTPEHLGEELPELDPPTEDEMVAQVRAFDTKELMEALDDLRKTQIRVRKAMRTVVAELNRRERIR